VVDKTLSEVERGTLRAFKEVTTNLIRNFKAENYESLVEESLNAY
jgi:hypothetical protein